jgi:hypothetical protein
VGAQPGENERAAARREAVRILSARIRLGVVGGLFCVLMFVAVLMLPVDRPAWILLVPTVVALVVMGWFAWTFFPRQRAVEEIGIAANVVDEPALYAWIADVTHRLGVAAPDSIRLAPSTGAWISDLTGSPALVLGTGWLSWLHVDEVNRLAAVELSMLRVREDPTIAQAVRLVSNLDINALRDSSLPIIGRIIRPIGARLALHREALYDACLYWAAAAIPTDLRPTDAEVGEGRLADEGWQVLSDRWIAPVAELGRGLGSLAIPHRELLVACQDSNLIERSWHRPAGPPALDMLSDPESSDAEVARWLADRASESTAPPIGWDEYIDQVTIPAWRTSLAGAVDAANRIRGSAQPMSLGTLLIAIESGSGLAIGAMLLHDEIDEDGSVDSNAARAKYDDALGTAFSHAVSLALVETGLASPVVHVLWGVVLEDLDGTQIPVESSVHGYCRIEDWAGLRAYVESLDLDPGQRLRLGGTYGDLSSDETPDVVAVRRWRINDIVFADGCLRAYPRSITRQATELVHRLTGLADAPADGYDDYNTDPHRVEPGVSIALSEVSSAVLFRRPNGLAWTMRLKTAQTTLNFTGVGDGAHVAPILQGVLRGRVAVTGLGARPSRVVRLLGKVGWYAICGGVLVLLAGVLGFAIGAGDVGGSHRTVATREAVATFGVLGAALIGIGMVPYLFIARRGHRLA